MKTTRSIARSFTLSLTALACLALSACSSVYGPQAKAKPPLDLDKLLQSNPPAVGYASTNGKVPHNTTRQDPASGLRVDVNPVTLAQPQDPSATDASLAQGDAESREAIGTPTDPLRPDTALNLSDVAATQDLWVRVRKGYALPVLATDLVADHERWYAARPDYVQRMTDRGSRYLFHVVEEIERRQMPTELALLPFIESAFNPQAQSSARASGIWQFMPATGKDFALRQNVFRDDRRDVLASTRAALDYLQRLYKQFGDWHLALAAYNWGEGNVQKAINRNLKQGLPTDYLSLNMPPETRNYVPKLHAVRNIIWHPETYGLTLTPIENHPYFVSVPIQRDMDSALAARLAGLPVEEFKALNPSQNKPVILAAGTPQVLLPYDNASLFALNLSKHKGPLASWTAWVVPRTMRPGEAAQHVGMNEGALRDINHIPPKMLVKAGSTLLVPRSQQREQDVSETLADHAMMALAPDLPPMRRVSFKAGKRDSVQAIAKRYRVSAQQVAQWNRTSATGTFAKGQSVVVFVPTKSAGNRTAQAASARSGRTSRVQAKASTRSVVVASAARNASSKSNTSRARPAAVNRNSRMRVASSH